MRKKTDRSSERKAATCRRRTRRSGGRANPPSRRCGCPRLRSSELTFHRHSTMGALRMSKIGELREAARGADGVRVQHDGVAVAHERVRGGTLAVGELDRLPASRHAGAGLARRERRGHRRGFHVRLRGRGERQNGGAEREQERADTGRSPDRGGSSRRDPTKVCIRFGGLDGASCRDDTAGRRARPYNRRPIPRSSNPTMSLDRVPAGKDVPNDCNVIIEIPMRGDPIKYEVDKDTGAVFVDRFMSTAMHYPCNYGYIPRTLSDDGDPCDVLLLSPMPLITGVVVRVAPDRHAQDGRRGGRRFEDPRRPGRRAHRPLPRRALAGRHAGDSRRSRSPTSSSTTRISSPASGCGCRRGSVPDEAKQEILDGVARYEAAHRDAKT